MRGDVFKIAAAEFAAAEKAGLAEAIAKRKPKPAAAEEEEVAAPPKEPCTSSIPGIEVMDLEDAVKVLWKAGIYAESGMGCTGPLVMMSDANYEKALELLKEAGFDAVDFSLHGYLTNKNIYGSNINHFFEKSVAELEAFFLSDWFRLAYGLNGAHVLRILREEVLRRDRS